MGLAWKQRFQAFTMLLAAVWLVKHLKLSRYRLKLRECRRREIIAHVPGIVCIKNVNIPTKMRILDVFINIQVLWQMHFFYVFFFITIRNLSSHKLLVVDPFPIFGILQHVFNCSRGK